MQVGKTMVLYRAGEQRILDLLRALALAVLVPTIQRYIRGHLARECRRRCAATIVKLRTAIGCVVGVAECDAARRAFLAARVMLRAVRIEAAAAKAVPIAAAVHVRLR